VEKNEVMQIPLEKLVQIENSRATYDPMEMSELMQSMRYSGVLQPIGVKPVASGKFQIIFGNRRYLAAKKLGWKVIPAIEQDHEGNELILNLTENIQRSAPPFLEQGRIVNVLIGQGLRLEEVATRLGISIHKTKQLKDAFREIPVPFRNRIAQTGDKHANKKKLIPPQAASTLINIGRTHELSEAQKREMFEWASENADASLEQVRSMGALMSQGLSLKQAIHEADSLAVLRVVFTFKKKVVESYPSRREFIREIEKTIAKNEALGFVSNRRARKVIVRKGKGKKSGGAEE
jgi:ParB/RepB/Spo0J family partition protein